jgi:eukaryotic-like serine/threonine-protein kinase
MHVSEGLLPDRYAGSQPIGRGGMGEIYRATDTTLGRAVAVKVLADRYARDENVRARFTREALAAARLSGTANIVTIYDVGEWRERPFIVMEYVDGGSLEERLRRGAVPIGQALDWLEQTAHALDAAHRAGVVHRDVKPANLLLDLRERIHVADFGIASAIGLDSLTQTGTVLGTASYLSPEQAQGGRATPASDLYALAVVAFELLTGRRPFEADSVTAEAAAHVTAPVPSACELAPSLPCEVDAVFERALAKDPVRRYLTAGELVAHLRAALEEAAGPTRIVAPPAPAWAPARRARPGPLVPALALLVLALAGAGIAYALTRGGSSAAPPVRVRTTVKTVTQQARTVVSTLLTTAAAPVTTTPVTTASAPTTASTAAAGGDPVAENDQGYALMNEGRYGEALPLLQDAQQQLDGQGNIAEAYTDYNLGYTLVQLGRCGEAMPYLERSKALQPGRKEVLDAIRLARKC